VLLPCRPARQGALAEHSLAHFQHKKETRSQQVNFTRITTHISCKEKYIYTTTKG
jgi:hypothetical protein